MEPEFVQPYVRRPAAGGVVGLGANSRPDVVSVHPALGDQAARPFLRCGVDDDDEMKARSQIVLDEQRDVLDDDGVSRHGTDELTSPGGDQRVHDRVQCLPAGLVTEDDLSQGGPIEGTIWCPHVRAELGQHRRPPGRTRPDDLASDDISIDQNGTPLDQPPRNR